MQYTHNKLNQMTGMSVTASGAATTTAFAYDASGNMTAQAQSNGGSTYTYDDANRLISLVQKDTATGVFTKRSDYVYDGLNRKAVSREYSWDVTLNNNVGGWVLNEDKRRIYNGLDVVQERDGSNTTKVNYTRSGHIGELLARSDSNGNYFFNYDGSGNVVGLTDSGQNTVAEYSYDAWGNALRAIGLMASVNAYRYSTKEYQSVSGLYDYGFRFYSPGMGRWINRDPIAEQGGLNLQGFVDNNPVNLVDWYGLAPRTGATGGQVINYSSCYDGVIFDTYGEPFGDKKHHRVEWILYVPPGYKTDPSKVDIDYVGSWAPFPWKHIPGNHGGKMSNRLYDTPCGCIGIGPGVPTRGTKRYGFPAGYGPGPEYTMPFDEAVRRGYLIPIYPRGTW